jgi:hypothetical protein
MCVVKCVKTVVNHVLIAAVPSTELARKVARCGDELAVSGAAKLLM